MPQGRPLTDGEEKLCRYVFRQSVNSRNIWVVRRPRTMHFGGFTPYGRINMDGNAYREDYIGDDLFAPPNPADAHHFLHELAHSWQHFVGMGMLHQFRLAQRAARQVRRATASPHLKFESIYHYDINSGTDLLDFTMEQQCEIIADFFAWTLWHVPIPPKAFGYPLPSAAQLSAVLTNFIADPSYPRNLTTLNNLRAQYRMVER